VLADRRAFDTFCDKAEPVVDRVFASKNFPDIASRRVEELKFDPADL
jgi:hypothetical protein